MVHYDPSLKLAQTPPPTCPTCGSHRTEIVGRSDNGKAIVLRCNACGSHNRVVVPSEEASGAPAAAGRFSGN